MQLWKVAAVALTAASSVAAQSVPDLSTATPLGGSWTYASAPDGSEARFAAANALPQLVLHCTRATRQVTIARPATAAAPLMNIWTSSQSRSIAPTYNPALARVTIGLGAYDALLDALATSRGRIGVGVGTQPALVVPAWPEAARVIEDCRA